MYSILRLTLLQRISGLGVPAAKHEKDTDPPIFLMYSALGLFSNVGGSLMMTWIGGDLPSLPRLLKGWHWYWPSCSGPTCNVNIDVLKYYFSKNVATGPEMYFSKYIIVCTTSTFTAWQFLFTNSGNEEEKDGERGFWLHGSQMKAARNNFVYHVPNVIYTCNGCHYFLSYTVWKFHDFSISQILREINFWVFRSAESAVLKY